MDVSADDSLIVNNVVIDEEFGVFDGTQQPASTEALPDILKHFIQYFRARVNEKNVYDIHTIYETSFNKLTDRFFKSAPWPSAEVIAPLVENDTTFILLYKELYYRHIYSKVKPLTSEQRIGSWKNYCELFDLFLNRPSPLELELPVQWLWDMIDEFIYQFQSFCQHRCKLKNKSRDDIQILKDNPDVWDVRIVLRYLQSFVDKSDIVARLKQGNEYVGAGQAGIFGDSTLYKMLGYFSIIGLVRVHCLLGDYYLALKTLDPIDLTNKKSGLFTRVTACHITLYYYLGFCYLIVRRYADAIRTFSHILLYISRTEHHHTRSYQHEQIVKKNEQMYALLAVALTLHPQRLDDNIRSRLKEKYGDKMLRMQRGDKSVYQELFSYACPKFVTPAAPRYDEVPLLNYSQEALQLQLKLFMNEVNQQELLPTIRSYLKLYTTIPIAKLAQFLELDEDTFRTQLLCVKHKTNNLVWAEGAAHSGSSVAAADIDFFIDNDMIHIADTKIARRYGDYFIRLINKFDAICNELEGRPRR